jgi:ankyrin repeat protein
MNIINKYLAIIGGIILYVSYAKATSVLLAPDPDYTPLHRAATHCDLDSAVLDLKAIPTNQKLSFINKTDRDGYTPLRYAARSGCLKLVELLVENGALVETGTGNHSGWTPLQEAASQWHDDVVFFLLKHGANVNAVSKRGFSPLGLALQEPIIKYGLKGNQKATIKILLANGADSSPLLEELERQKTLNNSLQSDCEKLKEQNQLLKEKYERYYESTDKEIAPNHFIPAVK